VTDVKPKSTIGKCPICETSLSVTELTCPSCRTRIVTNLKTCPFCNLNPELQRFLKTFLRARGNIKEVEKELGISYPTVRKRLDDLLLNLGLESGRRSPDAGRSEVFERLRKGDINVDDAIEALGRDRKED
jgi:hypothetical protein